MILALDTSGGELLVCLLDPDGRLIAGMAEPGHRHQERVMEVIQELLAARGGAAALSAVAVARGPGSQTGLRVGLATAEGLAFSRRLALIPVSSLDVAAHRGLVDCDVIAAVSAGRSNLYARLYRADGPGRVPVGDRLRCAIPGLHTVLAAPADTPVAAEPAVAAAIEAAGEEPLVPARPGPEALAAAVREAVDRDVAVAYDGLAGDYGDP